MAAAAQHPPQEHRRTGAAAGAAVGPLEWPMPPLDRLYFPLEEPGQQMTIGGTWYFGAPAPTYAATLAAFERWVRDFPVFQCRMTRRLSGRWYWETDPAFQLERHVRLLTTDTAAEAAPGRGAAASAEPASAAAAAADGAGHRLRPAEACDRAVRRAIQHAVATPFDRTYAPWVAYLVHVRQGGPTGAVAAAALVVCVHHAITDGQGAIRMVLQLSTLASTEAGGPRGVRPGLAGDPNHGHDPHSHPQHEPQERRVAVARSWWSHAAVVVGGRRASWARRAWAAVAALAALLALAASTVMHAAGDVVHIAAKYVSIWFSGHGLFVKPGGVAKEYASIHLAALEDVKRIARAHHATVNDVVLATLAGGLRAYLIQVEGVPPGRLGELNCVIPVSLRSPDDWSPGNQITICAVQLPVGLADPLARLRCIHRRLDHLKHSIEVRVRTVDARGRCPQAR